MMKNRVMRITQLGTIVLLATLVAGGGNRLAAQTAAHVTTYRLASAQVVTSTTRPPVLKLIASGPVAFAVLPADVNGEPAGPGRLIARLFGIAPGDIAAGGGELAPFSLTVTAVASANGTDTDTIVTIAAGVNANGSASGQALVLRPGMKANEIEAAIVTVP